jgi:hypothetical protein
MTTENPPLEPWQIEHIRKMKAGLPAASDAEEDTMDEELGALNAVADVDDAEAVDDAEGADLSVYKDPNVQASVTRRNKLAADYKKYYDDLTAKIMAQRTGPSFSERMYQLSAAFASPTSTRGFGGVMSNIMPVLQEQAKARREGVNKRQDALSALAAAQLGQRAGLANQDVTTALAMAKLNATANKPVRGVPVGDTLRNPYTNAQIGPEFNRVPKPEYYKALEAAPTPENLQAAVAYYPTFEVDLKAAYDRGLKNKGR